MVFTKEDLQKIKLPLSEKTYVNLHETEVSLGRSLYGLVPEDVLDAYEDMQIDNFNRKYGMGAAAVPTDSISWQPPQTEEYRDYPMIKYPREEALKAIEEWHRKHPDQPQQPDNLQTRMERWEETNGRKMSDLTPAEWIQVVSSIGSMTEREAEELLYHLQGL